ncbi:MAG: ABC transporter substrate-binding protein, partial [Lachnospiraceae bacterium]|nr:ABC transporter substrate-binding protein [Lachnospiraceae bacterium]
MKDSVKKLLIFVGAIAAIVVVCLLLNLRGVKNFHEKYEGHNLDVDIVGAQRTGTYSAYLKEHANAARPKTDVAVSIYDYSAKGKVEVVSNYSGASQALLMDADSVVTWKVNIPQSGFYNLRLEYLLPQSRGVAAERSLMIDGELPFEDAGNMVFSRIWTDGGEKRVDNQGNEIRPSQVEIYDWQVGYCKDSMGYVADPYEFYFEQGTREITFTAVNEPMVLKALTVSAVQETKSYAEYAASLPAVSPSSVGLTYNEVIEGENSARRSESSLYAKYDRASATTSPYSVTKTILNYTGGDAWKNAGQWIEWDITVPETGYYHITVKGRQNYNRGAVSGRMLTIDGEVPFKEVKDISFDYDNDWECKTLGDENGAYNFYLTAGTHTLRLEATLGEVGSVLDELEDSTFRLNKIYRKILVYTGATPDKYRDYKIQNVYPDTVLAMELEARRLYKAVDDMVAISGQKASQIATAQTLATQLERFVDRPEKITTEFTNFKDNITALGTSIL